MGLYRCKRCNIEKRLTKETLLFIEKKIRAKESKCICGEWMENKTKFKGFGTSFKAPNDKYKK